MQSKLFQPKVKTGFNLRILIYMNPLVVDKIAKTFLYEKDSIILSSFMLTRFTFIILNLPKILINRVFGVDHTNQKYIVLIAECY